MIIKAGHFIDFTTRIEIMRENVLFDSISKDNHFMQSSFNSVDEFCESRGIRA